MKTLATIKVENPNGEKFEADVLKAYFNLECNRIKVEIMNPETGEVLFGVARDYYRGLREVERWNAYFEYGFYSFDLPEDVIDIANSSDVRDFEFDIKSQHVMRFESAIKSEIPAAREADRVETLFEMESQIIDAKKRGELTSNECSRLISYAADLYFAF